MCRFVDFRRKSFGEGENWDETPEILPASAHSPWFITLRGEQDEKRGLSGQDKMGNVSCLSTSQFGQPQSLPLQMSSSGFSGRFLLELVDCRLAGQTGGSLS